MFTIIEQEDAISLTQRDHYGFGTSLEVIDGLKLWVYWPDMSEKDWEEFEDEGMWWMKGRLKWILLRPGDAISLTHHDHHGVQDQTLHSSLQGNGFRTRSSTQNLEAQ